MRALRFSWTAFLLVGDILKDGNGSVLEDAAPALAKCEAELRALVPDELKLWLLAAPADELDPLEKLLCEAPELDDPLELAEPPPLDECSAMRGDERNRMETITTMTRAESRIKHLRND